MSYRRVGFFAIVAVGLMLCAGRGRAGEQQPAVAAEAPAPAAEKRPEGPLTVAVFDFEAGDKAVTGLGAKIGDLMTVFLSANENLRLVERSKVADILKEMELGASGVVAPEQATRIGGLLGAQVLITGRAFVINEKLYVTARAIGVETSRVNAQLATGKLDQDLDAIVGELATKVAAWLKDNPGQMVAAIATPADQVAALKKALGKQELPTVAVAVFETHVGQVTIDPAAETELTYLMRKVGIPVLTGKSPHISDWAKEYLKDIKTDLPDEAKKADVLIVGEGFSEFAGRNGNLISVKARVELKAVHPKTGNVLAISRTTATQVDLAEQIAGKAALQKAASQGAVEILPQVVEGWNKLREEAKPKAGE
jgi:hypothetical protein